MSVLEQLPGREQTESEQMPSFDALYQRYYLRVYRYFRAHLDNDDDAADLAQQVFFQVWMHLYRYRPEKASAATWIFSIAHHRLIDFYRGVHLSISWEALSEGTAVDFNPEQRVIAAELISCVRKLLESLSQAERDLLALRFAARLSLAEIAAIIGKSEEATKKQLARLLQRLRQQYRRLLLDEVPLDRLDRATFYLEPSFIAIERVLLLVCAVPLPTARPVLLYQLTFV